MISLPDTLLGHMRAVTESLMTDTCRIDVAADSYGDMGELVEDYTTVATDVSCRIIDATRGKVRTAQQQSDREIIPDQVVLVVPYSTALAVDQRITMSDGTLWWVVGLITDRTSEVDAQAIVSRTRG